MENTKEAKADSYKDIRCEKVGPNLYQLYIENDCIVNIFNGNVFPVKASYSIDDWSKIADIVKNL